MHISFLLTSSLIKPLLALAVIILLTSCLILHIIPDEFTPRLFTTVTIAFSSSYYVCHSFYPANNAIYLLVHLIFIVYFCLLFIIDASLTISSSFYESLRKVSFFLYSIFWVFCVDLRCGSCLCLFLVVSYMLFIRIIH